ncbi:hypothetical protein [Wenxinia marina]|uniref:Uncharacterized protein conserved in bacteria, putative lipoprotein n=1 Tax=Wenxinia marina DSM 24838 TaxID=1123501 RepID=A0A0D0QIC2_9RHOB|nr:hypothetical protein [Wenxinia marina]KIQ70788.1 Uncharacterized protein conserved in bacteria, putative lipoprotein [Wenxinia marina DSM 24838]GGL57294.1 hypothetical protein GCM10011392_09700 [Wenxinia marina]
MLRAAALALCLSPLPAAAQEWCAFQSLSQTEQAICSSPLLGGLDAQLTEFYRRSDASEASQTDWLRRRNECGSDLFCIEASYRGRIAELTEAPGAPPAPAPAAPSEPLRPWCDASGLNPTEETVCANELLANMDAALGAVYGRAIARPNDPSQADWLRGDRDACGTDATCIGRAYLRRIVELGGRIRENGG